MHRATNLQWPSEPFGASQRPFAPDRPMMAAMALGWSGSLPRRPDWACVTYLYLDNTRTLTVDGWRLNFGFEVLTSEATDTPIVLPQRLDEIVVACRRHATILAGHDLASDLTSLTTLGTHRRLPGLDSVHQHWTDRQTTDRGVARMIDTAYDLDQPDATDLAAACEHAALRTATIIDPDDVTTAATLRRAIVRTLAIALIAARASSKYHWTTPVDLDQLVNDTAWDHFADAPPDIDAPSPGAAAGRRQD